MKDLETIGIKTYNDALENGRHESFFHYTDEKIFAAGYMDGYADSEKTKLDNIRFTITGIVCKDMDEYVEYVKEKQREYYQLTKSWSAYSQYENICVINNEIIVGILSPIQFYMFPFNNILFTENATENPNYEKIKNILEKGRC